MSGVAIVDFVSPKGFLRTKSNIAFGTVSILTLAVRLTVRYCTGHVQRARTRRDGMHTHVSIQADFLVRTVRALRASVLFAGADIFRRRLRRVGVRLAAARLGAGGFCVVVVGRFASSVRTVVGLVSFQSAQR